MDYRSGDRAAFYWMVSPFKLDEHEIGSTSLEGVVSEEYASRDHVDSHDPDLDELVLDWCDNGYPHRYLEYNQLLARIIGDFTRFSIGHHLPGSIYMGGSDYRDNFGNFASYRHPLGHFRQSGKLGRKELPAPQAYTGIRMGACEKRHDLCGWGLFRNAPRSIASASADAEA